MPTFNLIDQSWIPVIDSRGQAKDVSLREAMHQAPALLEIRDPLPTVEFGLYRLLVALTLDIFMPAKADRDTNVLGDLIEAGKFDSTKVDEYFEHWADRFDLFHPVHPFLQTATMDDISSGPLAQLVPAIPSATNTTHFHHLHESEFGVAPAVAARLLTTISPFMTEGGRGLSPSINGAPPWYALLRLRSNPSVFHTICLNCPVIPLSLDTRDRPPIWRSDRILTKEGSKTRRTSASLLESLTWTPRRVLLIPGSVGRCSVSGIESPVIIKLMKFAAGSSCDFSWTDPAVAYRHTPDGPRTLRPQEGREIWRDTGPVALLQPQEYHSPDGKITFSRPLLVTQFASLIQQGILSRSDELALTMYGLRTDKAKVFEWHREGLDGLPAKLIWLGHYHRHIQEAMERAEKAAYLIKLGIKKSYPREGAGNKAALESLVNSTHREYWRQLRPHYQKLLTDLALLPAEGAEQQVTACLDTWAKSLRQVARNCFDEAINNLDTDRWALKRQVEARGFFLGTLKSLFLPPGTKKQKKAAA